jgi:hypothetical protein
MEISLPNFSSSLLISARFIFLIFIIHHNRRKGKAEERSRRVMKRK